MRATPAERAIRLGDVLDAHSREASLNSPVLSCAPQAPLNMWPNQAGHGAASPRKAQQPAVG